MRRLPPQKQRRLLQTVRGSHQMLMGEEHVFEVKEASPKKTQSLGARIAYFQPPMIYVRLVNSRSVPTQNLDRFQKPSQREVKIGDPAHDFFSTQEIEIRALSQRHALVEGKIHPPGA